MERPNALTVASDAGLSAQRLIRLAPEYRDLLMEGVRDLWRAERDVVQAQQEVSFTRRRLREGERVLRQEETRRDRIRYDIAALLPELEALQEQEQTHKATVSGDA